ncbi:MAG: TerC/Alx family metal homeostasis membrane protein [Phycisphaeraceae bacterium]|nr:TerC/Alx family metal homeostasis membrane protein [Phycisphaeraceae bacterium]
MVWIYVGFIFFICTMLALDLGVVNRKAHVIRARESLIFTAFTVFLALSFAACVWWMYESNWPEGITGEFVRLAAQRAPDAEIAATGWGREATIKYLAAWVLEYSLSVDNIFVIAVIFGYFRVPAHLQHRVLFWGILGALVMRGAMIVAGVELVKRFEWVNYIFGLFLIYTAYKMFRSGEGEENVAHSPAVRLAQKMFRVTHEYHGSRFFIRDAGALVATPLFLALLVVEFTDVIFAVDSIPAVIGITSDPFIVFTSNVFAILGLRSLFFAVAAALGSFRYLKTALVFVLAFIGVKMLLMGVHNLRDLAEQLPEGWGWLVSWAPEHKLHVPTEVSLAIIVGMLALGVIASLFASAAERRRRRSPMEDMAEAIDLTRRNLRRVHILIAGSSVILVGIALAPIPGPGGIPVIIAGLMILATEFIWAKRLVLRMRRQANAMAATTEVLARRSSPWTIPPVLLIHAAAFLALYEWVNALPDVFVISTYFGTLLMVGFWAWRVVARHRRGE